MLPGPGEFWCGKEAANANLIWLMSLMLLLMLIMPLPASDGNVTANGMISMLGNISNMTVQLYPTPLTTAKSVLIALVEQVDSMKAWTPEMSLALAISWSKAKQTPICLSVGVDGGQWQAGVADAQASTQY